MSTSNPPDEDSFLGNAFLPLSGDSSLRDQSSRIRALESQVSDLTSEMTSSHKKLDLLISLMAEKSSDKPSSPSIPTPPSPPPATRQSVGGLVLTPGIGTNSVQLPSSVGTVTVLSTQLANLRPKLHALTLYHCILFVRAFMDWRNMSSTIDSSLVQCIGQGMETIFLELAIQDFTTFRALSDSDFMLRLNDYFLSDVRRLHVFCDMVHEISVVKPDEVKNNFCLTISHFGSEPVDHAKLFPGGNGPWTLFPASIDYLRGKSWTPSLQSSHTITSNC